MKRCLHILSLMVGLVMLVACTKPTKVEVPEPVETLSSPALAEIDTLMWQQPDSALAVMMEFGGARLLTASMFLTGITARC